MKKYRLLLVAFLVAFTIPQAFGSGVSFPSTYHADAVAITGGTIVNTRLGGMSAITNSLTSDVALNNITLYFDGPSVAQGTVGTWFVMGTVCFYDTVQANFVIKLWDGTTLISSGRTTNEISSAFMSITLSGIITNPTGNLRISVNDATTVNGKIRFNGSGNPKDSTITAIRID